MKALFIPFYSQQNKLTGKFLLNSCGSLKWNLYFAEKVKEAFGCQISIVTPHQYQCQDIIPVPDVFEMHIPPSNSLQRVHWNVNVLEAAFHNVDLIVTSHEYLAIPLREIVRGTNAKIVHVQHLDADRPRLFEEAWDSSDLVATPTKFGAATVQARTKTRVTAWPAFYNEDQFPATMPPGERDIDVLFVARCSVTNHTHHEEFMTATSNPNLQGMKIVYTDVTNYLKLTMPHLAYSYRETYFDTLLRSKVAVSLQDQWHGGIAIREAVRCGCIPVVKRCPAMEEWLGASYPFYVNTTSPDEIADVTRWALVQGWACPQVEKARTQSYQAAWPLILNDLSQVVGR